GQVRKCAVHAPKLRSTIKERGGPSVPSIGNWVPPAHPIPCRIRSHFPITAPGLHFQRPGYLCTCPNNWIRKTSWNWTFPYWMCVHLRNSHAATSQVHIPFHFSPMRNVRSSVRCTNRKGAIRPS